MPEEFENEVLDNLKSSLSSQDDAELEFALSCFRDKITPSDLTPEKLSVFTSLIKDIKPKDKSDEMKALITKVKKKYVK